LSTLDKPMEFKMARFLIFIILGSIGAVLIFASGRETRAREDLRVPIISARGMHLIGLLFIFAGMVIFVSQFLIYSK